MEDSLRDKTQAGTVHRTDRVRRVYADFPIYETDFTVAVCNTAAARAGRLPPAQNCVGRRLVIKDESGVAGTNPITLYPLGAQTIDGAASKAINTNYGSVTLRSTGTGWVTE